MIDGHFQIQDLTIENDDIKDTTIVASDKVVDYTVTNVKLADNSVDQRTLADNAVGANEIIDGSISDNHVAASAVIATSKLAEGSSFFKKDGTVVATGNFDLGSKKITNLADGTNSGDAVNKGQVELMITNSVTSLFEYKGTLDAAVGSLPVSPATGDYYKITVAGNFGGASVDLLPGDGIIWNGSAWDKIDNTDPIYTGSNGVTVSGLDISADIKNTSLTLDASGIAVNYGGFVYGEFPAQDVVDGRKFTLASMPVAGKIALFYNGVRLAAGPGNDYTVSGQTITIANNHRVPDLAKDNVIVDYIAAPTAV